MDKITTLIQFNPVPSTVPASNKARHSVSFRDVLNGLNEKVGAQQNSTAPQEPNILVGEITAAKPTVSELLMEHKDLKVSAWEILNSKQNLDKNYTSIQPGTSIYYNVKEGALTWSAPAQTTAVLKQQNISVTAQPSLPGISAHNSPEPQSANKTQLGVINEENPTVSHLLKNHPSLHSDTWDILSSAVNRDKDFTRLPFNTLIQFDSATGEITWQPSEQNRPDSHAMVTRGAEKETAPISKAINDTGIEKRPLIPGGDQPVLLGKVDQNNTTVSHLLSKHPQLREQTWEILSSKANQDKAFDRIANGTEIYLQPENMEILWGAVDSGPPIVSQATSVNSVAPLHNYHAQEYTRPATDLSEAVRPFLGTSYKEIDCYELLVKGLGQMDIPYGGRDGLYTKLTQMARDQGMPVNAYLNGEGIIKASGSLVLTNNYRDMTNWKQQAQALIREMEPLLDKGQILSFSTEKRGHTGIVSQQDNQWTFINSGRLDNSVASGSVRHGVGEEVLQEEIHNWFKLAHAKRETLTVTLGRLEQSKIRTASNFSNTVAGRI